MINQYISPQLPSLSAPFTPYVHPSDWIDISSVANNEINLLSRDGFTVAFSNVIASSGTYSIDWGDGTIQTARASGTTCQHTYPLGTGTVCSLGYRTNAIRIYNATGNITRFKIQNHNLTTGNQISPILWAVFGTANLTDFSSAFCLSTAVPECKCLLQEIIMPPSFASCSTTSNAFKNCNKLESISNFTWGSVTDASYMFSFCTSLKDIKLPSSWGSVTSTSYMFDNCTFLTSIILPASFGNVTNISFMFNQCARLIYEKGLTDWGAATSVSSLFFQCTRLLKIQLPEQWGVNMTNIANIFSSMPALESITLPTSWRNVTSTLSMFNACYNLRSVNLPDSWGNIFQISGMFSTCSNLREITLPATWGSISSTQAMFSNCNNLVSVTLPASWGSISVATQMFFLCTSLKEITLPSSWGFITAAGNMFTYCYNLIKANIPANWNSIGDFTSAFENCYNLSYVTPCTTLGGAPNMTSMFKNCFSLPSFSFPAASNNVPNITSAFVNCTSLIAVTNFGSVGASNTNQQDGTSFDGSNLLETVSVGCRLSKFSMAGTTTNQMRLNSLRLTNASSTFGGTSPQVNVSYTSLGIAALNQLFTDLPSAAGKTINITGCTGAAGCTRTIATAKGWTVTG
jgi:hypothetical protein